MPWSQFYRWMQFMEVQPFGERRQDLRIGYAAAHLASIIAATQGVKDISFRPIDFVPDFTGASTEDIHPITEEEWREWKDAIRVPIVNID